MATGRPREFDIDQALDRALNVFWRKGYEGTTLPDLTRAMGINRPSLYAAFGNKEELFRKALDRYAAGPASHAFAALNEPTARAVVERLWYGAVEMATHPQNPAGCLLVQGVRRDVAARRAAGVAALRRRFQRAVAEGDLPADANPADLARYVATVTYGMAVQAASGASRAQLRRVAQLALRNWPTS
jgi:AcrR family transcriptional regulator